MLQQLPDNIEEENNLPLEELNELETEKVNTIKDEEFKMKTCLDDLIVEDFIIYWREEEKSIWNIKVSVKHKTLPFRFAQARAFTRQMIEGDGEHAAIGATILDLFQDILRWVDNGVANTLVCTEDVYNKDDFTVHSKKLTYQPEYDKEKKAWFILDKDNNKVY